MSKLCPYFEHMSSIIYFICAMIAIKRIKMPREKSVRKLSFKPIVNSFIPKEGGYNGVSSLLHEEIEAIYMMDVLDLYQEEAAKKMEVSRTTFTRILKSARKKLATALVSGFKIDIEDSKSDITVAICADGIESFEKTDPLQEYILIYKIQNDNVEFIKSIKNPAYQNKQKPAIVLPNIFLQNSVNVYLSSKIGEGLKNSLISKGIKTLTKKNIDIDSLKKVSIY